MLKKIVTHGGKAHLDDYMSVVIALAAQKLVADETMGAIVERRDPTPEELEDPETLVLDVGGVYDPAKGNYDHHQLGRGSKESAMTLLASNIGLPNGAFDGSTYVPGAEKFPTDSLAEFLEQVYPWFRCRADVDSNGPFAVAKAAGTDWSVVEPFLGPFEDIVLAAFTEAEPEVRWETAGWLALDIVEKWEAYANVAPKLKVDLPWWSGGKLIVADFTDADPKETEKVSDALTPKKGVAIFHDNRGEGYTLLRLGDDPRIDFSRVKDDPEVTFAHAGGFIAKTRSKDLGKAWKLIEAAYKGE